MKQKPLLLEALARLKTLFGDKQLVTDADRLVEYTTELRGRYPSECLAVVLPESPQQVSEIVRFCTQHKLSMVPQGGNTGAMGGAVSRADQIIVNLKRMNKILDLDPSNATMTVQAGCILAKIHETAQASDLLFPLSLGSQGSCQIGGNLATNAGGINVLHYGNARDLVLGVEVVLANGKILNCLNALRKNNTGYDLKNLFIGSEGTLGIITSAVLKLFPYPHGRIVFIAAVDSVSQAVDLMVKSKTASSDRLTSFELMSRISVKTAFDQIPGQNDPFDEPYPWYILAIVDSSAPDSSLKDKIQHMLENAFQESLIRNAIIGENEKQSMTMIKLREDIVEAQKALGGSIKHDVSVPVSSIADFMDQACKSLSDYMEDAVPYPYGHLGDGNMHFNISQPPGMETDTFLGHWKTINAMMHDITHKFGGSFSAEHGIGISKLDEMDKYKTDNELELYRGIKTLLDPNNIMNPGKVLR